MVYKTLNDLDPIIPLTSSSTTTLFIHSGKTTLRCLALSETQEACFPPPAPHLPPGPLHWLFFLLGMLFMQMFTWPTYSHTSLKFSVNCQPSQ